MYYLEIYFMCYLEIKSQTTAFLKRRKISTVEPLDNHHHCYSRHALYSLYSEWPSNVSITNHKSEISMIKDLYTKYLLC